VDVPDVSGKTPGEAEQTLKDSKLALGEVTDAVTSEPEKIGKVMSQTPVAGTKADVNTAVAIIIGKASDGESSETAKVDVPDVSGKTREEAEQTLIDSKLALGDVSEEVTSEVQNIGKVVSQTPVAGTKADANNEVAITIGKASIGK
jgi:eukaryotic-like serine/threonine-protein kinase